MIGYVTIGTNDIDRAAKFYDALLAEMGAKRAMDSDRFVAWSDGEGATMLMIIKPADENPAVAGNGNMVALHAGSNDKVDELYAKAMSLGATDEGKPGLRQGTFYGGYFRDPDGNKLVFFNM
ncbi:MAG: VOC family protein [Gammaproteobacteria bacterium]|nr:VOC family protein [Gammaproteobacteria bacterium]MCZ6772916.1 VOC family protein [Pseudomonadota bacterium]MCZ6894582.1 VOC family protein [Gammaproteobacteria bacterium]